MTRSIPASVPNVEASAPAIIYLVIGEGCPPDADFKIVAESAGEDLTWSEFQIDPNSIQYIRASAGFVPLEKLQALEAQERVRSMRLDEATDLLSRLMAGLKPNMADVERVVSRCRAVQSLNTASPQVATVPAKPVAPQVDLREIAEKAGISMDCWDAGAASLAYSKGCNGITREHIEKFASLYGFACWNAALEANPPHMQGMVSRAIDGLLASQPEHPPGLSLEQEPKYTVNGHAIVNRASGECIPADEPVFIFRARDVHAREALGSYASVLTPSAHRDAVVQRVADFSSFAHAHPERMKEPDTAAIRQATFDRLVGGAVSARLDSSKEQL